MTDLNPQAQQMADESMVRTLAAQARAIWPQEEPLFARYGVADEARILDAGCGTGEVTSRLAQLFPRATVLGIDIIDHHLELARTRYADLAPRVKFEHRSISELDLPNASFDLTVCRHVIHSVPFPDRVIGELARVTRPGGYLHIIAEDYGMLHFQPASTNPSDFWHQVVPTFGAATGTDLLIGRDIYGILAAHRLENIRIDYAVVDTLRVPRETFAAIIKAWRDGYVGIIGEITPVTSEKAREYFDQMIANIMNPQGYAVWMVPIASARIPDEAKG